MIQQIKTVIYENSTRFKQLLAELRASSGQACQEHGKTKNSYPILKIQTIHFGVQQADSQLY